MRARYYEASTGRFVSEDPSRDGANWFAYCQSNPILSVDPDGKRASVGQELWQGLACLFALAACGIAAYNMPAALKLAVLAVIMTALSQSYTAAMKAAVDRQMGRSVKSPLIDQGRVLESAPASGCSSATPHGISKAIYLSMRSAVGGGCSRLGTARAPSAIR